MRGQTALRWLLALFYAGAGALHLARTDAFLLILPDLVPFPRAVVVATGVFELLGAVGLLVPRTRRLAGIMLALYAVCVFPANVKHAVDGIVVPGLPSGLWYHALRLPLQPLIVWAALFAGDVTRWPLARRKEA